MAAKASSGDGDSRSGDAGLDRRQLRIQEMATRRRGGDEGRRSSTTKSTTSKVGEEGESG